MIDEDADERDDYDDANLSIRMLQSLNSSASTIEEPPILTEATDTKPIIATDKSPAGRLQGTFILSMRASSGTTAATL